MSAEEPRLGDLSPMSARTFIANALYEHAKWQPDEINYRLDAFAHELAEKLRDERPQWGDAWRHYGQAADLIDPEA